MTAFPQTVSYVDRRALSHFVPKTRDWSYRASAFGCALLLLWGMLSF